MSNGKGDAPRSCFSQEFKSNYDLIDWTKKSSEEVGSPVASIERILEVIDHPNADRLSICKVLGYHVITRKDEFKAGELCVYIKTDSILEPRPEYEFLAARKYKIKTQKLRGEFSEGICFPLTILPNRLALEIGEGLNVSAFVGATHYEKPIPMSLRGNIRSMTLPFGLSPTYTDRLQNYPEVMKDFQGKEVFIAIKFDGTSGTFACRDGDFRVCSRRLDLMKPDHDNNIYWKIAEDYNLEDKLKTFGLNIAIRGEIIGGKIRGNHAGVKEGYQFWGFDIFDFNNNKYLDYNRRNELFDKLGMFWMIDVVTKFEFKTIQEVEDFAATFKYPINQELAEGVVIRPTIETLTENMGGSRNMRRLAVKVLNKEYEFLNG